MNADALLTPGALTAVTAAVGWLGKRLDGAFTSQSAKVDALVEKILANARESVASSEARTEKVVTALTEVAGLVRDARDVLHRTVTTLERVERLLEEHDDRPSQRGSRAP